MKVIQIYRPKSQGPAFNAPPNQQTPPSSPASSPHATATAPPPPEKPQPPCSLVTPMMNLPIDPRLHVTAGFTHKVRIAPREPRRMRVFLGSSVVKANENLTIALMTPSVNKADFYSMAEALLQFMRDEHQVRQLEVEQCPFGDAYVWFDCLLERTRFLRGPPLHFGQYSIWFIKHDIG